MELNGSTRVSPTKARRLARLRRFGTRAALAALVTTTTLAASAAYAQSCLSLQGEIVASNVNYANNLLSLGFAEVIVDSSFCIRLVNESYSEILQRNPDNAGLSFWTGVCVDKLEDGDGYAPTAEFIVDAFLDSEEFAEDPSCN